MDRSQFINNARSNMVDLSRGNLGVPLLLLVMLAMMMLPIPPFLLDVFFTFNIALSNKSAPFSPVVFKMELQALWGGLFGRVG
ncbi:hypothetical protein EMIT0P176_50016 [Pseudomonas sp. IT-P176]